MWVLFTFSWIAILLTFLESIGKLKKGMFLGFVIMTIVAALRYNYGNDYLAYYYHFQQIARYSSTLFDYLDFSDGLHEQGWKALMFMFKPFGFLVFVALLAIINSVTYYKLIAKYVDSHWYPFAVFIYLFTSTFYPMSLSMLRQGLAMALIVLAIPYINQGKKWLPILFLIFAMTIHTSAIICVPFVLLLYIPFTSRKLMTTGIIVAFAFFIFAQNFVYNIMSDIVTSSDTFQKYDNMYFNGEYKTSGSMTLIGTIFFFIPIVMSLYAIIKNKSLSEIDIKLIVFTMIGPIFILAGHVVPMAGRVGLYFSIISIATYPIVFKSISNNSIRIALLSLFIFNNIKSFFEFMTSNTWSKYFGDYHTIFSI